MLYARFKCRYAHTLIMVKKILTLGSDKTIAGVCSGLAEYFDIDVTLVRVPWIISIFFSAGGTLLAYLICWIVFPKK